MIGVGFKILGRTPVPKLPPSYPPEALSMHCLNIARISDLPYFFIKLQRDIRRSHSTMTLHESFLSNKGYQVRIAVYISFDVLVNLNKSPR